MVTSAGGGEEAPCPHPPSLKSMVLIGWTAVYRLPSTRAHSAGLLEREEAGARSRPAIVSARCHSQTAANQGGKGRRGAPPLVHVVCERPLLLSFLYGRGQAVFSGGCGVSKISVFREPC